MKKYKGTNLKYLLRMVFIKSTELFLLFILGIVEKAKKKPERKKKISTEYKQK